MNRGVEREPSLFNRISAISHEKKAAAFGLGGLIGSLLAAGISPQVSLMVLLGGVGGMGYQTWRSYREPNPKPR